MSELIEFREAKDSFIAKDPHSPLTKEQKREFGGLSYYEEQRDLRLELQPEAYPEQETIEMQTSTGGVSRFIRSDKISFDADGESVQLTLYKDPESGDYFLPFADGTSGRETYGAARWQGPRRLQLRIQSILRLQRQLDVPDHPSGEPGQRARPRRRKEF